MRLAPSSARNAAPKWGHNAWLVKNYQALYFPAPGLCKSVIIFTKKQGEQ